MEFNGHKLIGSICKRCNLMVKGSQYTWNACRCPSGVDPHGVWVLPDANGNYAVNLSDDEMRELLATNTTPRNQWQAPDIPTY